MSLPVPLLNPLQEDGFSCIPRCVKMVFMYIQKKFPEGRVPDFDLDKISEIIDTRADGTYPDMVLKLNDVPEVLAAIPSIDFEFEYKHHEFNEIITEWKKEQPPIAMIDLDHHNGCKHAVVITYVDEPNNRIFYNDPVYGKRSQYVPDFLASWDNWDRELVKVKIGKNKQRMLEEFGTVEK